ncbi:hypothetical protein PQX77_013260 [Marasmius sp. AFHP31]|nr:hypothetical protein PQX77_013260 [Marasmius sp. AFHP31]
MDISPSLSQVSTASSLIATDRDLHSKHTPLAFELGSYDVMQDTSLEAESYEDDDVKFLEEEERQVRVSDKGQENGRFRDHETTQDEERDPQRVNIGETSVTSAGQRTLSTPAGALKDTVYKTLALTPQTLATGRDYSRPTIFQKLSFMHIYGGLCNLTLLDITLHMCHLIAVATDESDVRMYGEAIGHEVLNIHSSLNFLMLSPHLHTAHDKGHIKFVPTDRVMDSMLEYLMRLHELREQDDISPGEYYNEVNSNLQRRKHFPPGNFPYKLIGVLCGPDFYIHRQEYEAGEDFTNPEVKTIEPFGVGVMPFDLPLRAPAQKEGVEKREKDLSKSEIAETFKHHHRHQKDLTLRPGVMTIIPTTCDPDLEFWLSADPFFVVINTGEFLDTLRRRFVKMAPPGTEFDLGDFIEDESHANLLRKALHIFDKYITGAPEAPLRPGQKRTKRDERASRRSKQSKATANVELETPSRPARSKAGTRSKADIPKESKSQGAKKRKAPDDEGGDANTSRRPPSPRRSRRNKEAPENGLYVPPPGKRI